MLPPRLIADYAVADMPAIAAAAACCFRFAMLLPTAASVFFALMSSSHVIADAVNTGHATRQSLRHQL